MSEETEAALMRAGHQIESLQKALTTAKERIRKLEKVLQFYADENNYYQRIIVTKYESGVATFTTTQENKVLADKGQRARAVMGKLSTIKPDTSSPADLAW